MTHRPSDLSHLSDKQLARQKRALGASDSVMFFGKQSFDYGPGPNYDPDRFHAAMDMANRVLPDSDESTAHINI